ncbi:MAG: DUF6777 domain-containing protein, partial [Actinomycetota bacterium]
LVLGEGITVRVGIEPGLYGGSGSDHLCDPQLIAEFLAQSPDKAAAWADAAGIEVDGIESFLDGLTPVHLQADTWVTNHGFRDGAATPRQSILQAGTMVLVDEFGVPRVRCRCGNPLQPPQIPDDRSSVEYVGEPWSGFDPENLLSIEPGAEAVEWFEVVRLEDGRVVVRPVGSVGDADATVDPDGDWVPVLDLRLPSGAVVGDGPFALPELTSAATPIEYETSGPCRVVGGELVLTGEGRCVLSARSAPGAPWAPLDVEYRIDVGRQEQEIRVADIETLDLADGATDLAAVADSLLPLSSEVSGPCTIDGTVLVPVGVGTCEVTLSQDGNDGWAPAPDRVLTIEITDDPDLQPVEIALDLPTTVRLGADPLTLTAVTNPDRPVDFVAAGACSLVGADRLVFDTVGECEVIAVADGGSGYRRAVARSVLTVTAGAQTLGLGGIPRTAVVSSTAVPLPATSSAGLAITYTVTGPCRLGAGGLQLTGPGSCVVDASAPGNAETEPVDQRLTITVTEAPTVERRAQTITFAQPGALQVGGAGIRLTATASSGLPVALTVTDGDCRLSAGSLTPGGAGRCTVVASQPGNAEVEPAEPVTRTVTVARLTPTLTVAIGGGSATEMVEGERRTVTATVSSGPAAVITSTTGPCSASGPDQIRADGTAGTCRVTVAAAGDADHDPVSRNVTIRVKVRQRIDLQLPVGSIPVGGRVQPQATSSAGLTVTLSASPAAICGADGANVVGRAPGRCTITATAPGNDEVTAASATAVLDVEALRVPEVTITAPATMTVGEAVVVRATSSEPGAAITITASGAACDDRGNGSVAAVARGTCTVTASHPETPGAQAGSARATIEVIGQDDAIDFDCIGPCELSQQVPARVAIVSRSGLVPEASVSGPCVITGSRTGPGSREVTIAADGVGTCNLSAQTNGDASWNPASASLTLAVVGQPVSLSFDLGAPLTVGEQRSFRIIHPIPPDVVVVEAQGSPTCSVDVDGTGRQGIVVGRATGLCVVTIRVSGEGYA